MRTFESIKVAVGFMNEQLKSGLILLSGLDHNDPNVKKSIYLHCTMLVFYGFLDQALGNSSFEKLFNDNLTHLDLKSDELFSTRLSELSLDDVFQASSLLTDRDDCPDEVRSELFFVTQFAPVLMAESQKIQNAKAAQIASLQQWKMIAGAGVILALAASIIFREVLLFTYASPLISMLYLAMMGFFVAEWMMGRQITQRLEDCTLAKVVIGSLFPSVNVSAVHEKVREFFPVNQDGLQENDDILPKNADGTVSFIKSQSLFFKTPSLLTVKPQEFVESFAASNPSNQRVGAH